METAGGIDDDGVKPVFDCVLDGFLRRADGILRAALEHGQPGLLANDLQLFDGSGAIDVAGGQQHVLAVFLEHFAQLRAVRRLARSLQAAHQDDRRRLGSDLKLTVGAAHQRNELFVDNFNDLLRGNEAFEHLASYGTLGDFGHKVLDDLEVDVRLQQREFDLAHTGFDIGLGQLALISEFGKSLRHFVDQALKHKRTLPSLRCSQRKDLLRLRTDGLVRAFFENAAGGALIGRLARDEAERALQEFQLLLPALQRVPHALTGDTEMFGHLGKREIVVII